MAGCGCGGSGGWEGDGLVPADRDPSYFSTRTEADGTPGQVTSDLAEVLGIPTTGAKRWNPDTGRTED